MSSQSAAKTEAGTGTLALVAEKKDLYEIGEIPPLGHVPKNMYAWAIRKERHGEPDTAMQVEVLPTWPLDSHDVLVLVMAAGVNYNGVWASLGKPISTARRPQEPLSHRRLGCLGHRLGGRLQGEALEGRRRGRHPLQPGRRRRRGVQRRRSDVLAHRSASGATRRPTARSPSSAACRTASCWSARKHLTWEESACYTLVLATAYRMLFGHRPHVLRPGHNVLVWGASGGLGSMAVQLCATSGANAIGVVSEEDKRDFVMQLGARGVINRKDFDCWGELPKVGTPEYDTWFKSARKFGAAIWEITGKGNNVDFVFEHPGQSTFPVSVFIVKRGGMVVICAGTTGYNLTMDARYLWMHQKRVQGSHFANLHAGGAGQQARRRAAHRSVHVGGLSLGADPQGAHAHVPQRA